MWSGGFEGVTYGLEWIFSRSEIFSRRGVRIIVIFVSGKIINFSEMGYIC